MSCWEEILLCPCRRNQRLPFQRQTNRMCKNSLLARYLILFQTINEILLIGHEVSKSANREDASNEMLYVLLDYWILAGNLLHLAFLLLTSRFYLVKMISRTYSVPLIAWERVSIRSAKVSNISLYYRPYSFSCQPGCRLSLIYICNRPKEQDDPIRQDFSSWCSWSRKSPITLRIGDGVTDELTVMAGISSPKKAAKFRN